ncbi:hypothetical protein LIER_05784 [Lithospermum erythrorhizon]|uniref:Uncharacterized protein n=1 Tax=Lithospermum erythrorhizon TaxID=34254 RepID=A0AAV3P6Q2_LITER
MAQTLRPTRQRGQGEKRKGLRVTKPPGREPTLILVGHGWELGDLDLVVQNKVHQDKGTDVAVPDGDFLVVSSVQVVHLLLSYLGSMKNNYPPLLNSLEVSPPPLFCPLKVLGREGSFPGEVVDNHHLRVQLLKLLPHPIHLSVLWASSSSNSRAC